MRQSFLDAGQPLGDRVEALHDLGEYVVSIGASRGFGRPVETFPSDPRALALPADDQTFIAEYCERALHGAKGNAVLGNQFGLLGQALTWPKRAVVDRRTEVIGDLLVGGSGAIGVNFSHVSERTGVVQIGDLEEIDLTRLTMLSNVSVVPVVAGFSSARPDNKKALVSAGTPTRAGHLSLETEDAV